VKEVYKEESIHPRVECFGDITETVLRISLSRLSNQ